LSIPGILPTSTKGGEVVGLGVLIHHQRAGIGFAAGGEIGVLDFPLQAGDGEEERIKVLDELHVRLQLLEAEAARQDIGMLPGDGERLGDKGTILVAEFQHALPFVGVRSMRKGGFSRRVASAAVNICLAHSFHP
jgi:hypothetical protein